MGGLDFDVAVSAMTVSRCRGEEGEVKAERSAVAGSPTETLWAHVRSEMLSPSPADHLMSITRIGFGDPVDRTDSVYSRRLSPSTIKIEAGICYNDYNYSAVHLCPDQNCSVRYFTIRGGWSMQDCWICGYSHLFTVSASASVSASVSGLPLVSSISASGLVEAFTERLLSASTSHRLILHRVQLIRPDGSVAGTFDLSRDLPSGKAWATVSFASPQTVRRIRVINDAGRTLIEYVFSSDATISSMELELSVNI